MIGPVQFATNKYLACYLRICNRARVRFIEIGESHHVIPKAFGGTNGRNLVRLTVKEHFLCHWLLTKFTFGAEKRKMCYALNFMTRGTAKHASRIKSSWRLELAKKAQRDGMIGNRLTVGFRHDEQFKAAQSERMKGNKITLGYKQSDATRARVSASLKGNSWNTGKTLSPETKEKMRRSQTGRRHSEETKAKMSAAAAGNKRAVGNKNYLRRKTNSNQYLVG